MKHIITSILYLLALMCLSVFVFDPTHLYYELPWLDIPMHMMAGFGVASLTVAISSYNKKKVSYKHVFLTYIAVAFVWEVYEFARHLVDLTTQYGWLDTVKDIIDGAIGASVAYFLLKKD